VVVLDIEAMVRHLFYISSTVAHSFSNHDYLPISYYMFYIHNVQTLVVFASRLVVWCGFVYLVLNMTRHLMVALSLIEVVCVDLTFDGQW
jgi:hypothetical protein